MNPPVPTPGSSCNWRARKCRCSDPAISAPHRPGQPARASCAARCASVRPSARSARPRAVCSSQRQSDAPHGRRFRRPPTLRGACSSGRICWISAGSAHCSTANSSRAIWSSSIGACGSAAPEVCRPSICLQRRAEPGLLLSPPGEGWDGGFRDKNRPPPAGQESSKSTRRYTPHRRQRCRMVGGERWFRARAIAWRRWRIRSRAPMRSTRWPLAR